MSIKSKAMSRGNSFRTVMRNKAISQELQYSRNSKWKEKLPPLPIDPSKLFYGINRAGRRKHFKMRCDFFKKTPGGKHARNLFYRSM